MEHSDQKIEKEIIISISALNKWYGDLHVLKDIDLDVEKGKRIVIAGPSGSGKSTLIRCINALEKYQKGSIIVNGVELIDDHKIIKLWEGSQNPQSSKLLIC